MPRVLSIVNSLNPGGAERHVVSLLNHLDSAEFPGGLAYLHPGDALLSELRPNRRTAAICGNVSGRIDRGLVNRLSAEIDRDQIEVVFCTNMFAMLYGWLARRGSQRRTRQVVAFHTTNLGSWRHRFQMAFYWHLFRQCDHLVYVCGNQREHWRGLGLRAKADSVIYNGIDTDHYVAQRFDGDRKRLRAEAGFAESDVVVGICAGLRPEKAHGDLLLALALLRDKGVAAKCLVIGDGPERQMIEGRLVDLGLQGHVFMAGFQRDVRPWVAACDVMAIVSHAVETFSLSALESMAMEKPMVMSRIGGASEQVKDGYNGWLFPPGDVEALADRLTRCTDVNFRRLAGANARAVVVDRFDIADMTRNYADLFREIALD